MKQTSWLAFSIDRNSKTSIFEQICAAIRERAVSGDLAEGSRLPPTRAFATELGVSRSTVVTAYEQLAAEGYLQARVGSGYTVCAFGEVELPSQSAPSEILDEDADSQLPVPFEASQPDMQLFPHRAWAKAVARVCRTNPQSMLVGGSMFGNFELRKAIANHVSEWRGIEASPNQILITAGSTDALEICMRALTHSGDFIGLENPGYPPAKHFAEAHGLSMQFLEIDEGGARLPDGINVPRMVMLTPSHQYPLGGAMSPYRRLEYIRWAGDNGSWLIEDDYDSEFRYAGRPIPAMAGFDQLSRTIYIGSFSKIFSNSLRLGYVIMPRGLRDRFYATMKQFGLKASYMPQQALAEFINSGEFYRHLRRVRRTYSERRKFLLDRLSRDFATCGWFEDHQAGMQVVFMLNDDFADVEISKRAAAHGVIAQPLSGLSQTKTRYNGLILGFCGYDEVAMERALTILKTCFTQNKA